VCRRAAAAEEVTGATAAPRLRPAWPTRTACRTLRQTLLLVNSVCVQNGQPHAGGTHTRPKVPKRAGRLGRRRQNQRGAEPSSAHRVRNTAGGCRAARAGAREEADPSPKPGQKTSNPEPFDRLPREAVESPSLEIFQHCLDAVLCSLLWVTLLGQGVGLGDPQRALPTPTIL